MIFGLFDHFGRFGYLFMPSLLITGTDTDVGKTIIAAALARAWRNAGHDIGVMKPIACGALADTHLLLAASGASDPENLVTPLFFRDPLAANVAARREGREIDLASANRALTELQRRHTHLIIEGFGGALAPVTDEIAFADWVTTHRLPALVVARTDLGTLNHTLLTLEALAARDIPLVGVVLNRCHGGPVGLAEQTNPDTLARITDVPLWGPVEFVEGVSADCLPPLPFAEEIRARLTVLDQRS